jgi:hypothetical protein
MIKWDLKKLRLHFTDTVDEDLLRRFARYHFLNPKVYGEFVRLCRLMHNRGREHYGQRTIIEVMRWDHDLNTRGDPFKINNDYGAIYARMTVTEFPELKGFFAFRRMQTVGRRMSHEESRRLYHP